MWQATKDYVSAIPGALLHTVETPGAVMAANPYPPGSEEAQYFEDSRQKAITEGAPALASMTYAGAGPRLAGGAVAAKVGTEAQAINRLVEMTGPENVPAAVARMQANPRLTLADVSDPVRTATQGLIDPAQPGAQNAITEAVKNRLKGATQSASDAYTETLGAPPDVLKTVETLKNTAQKAGREGIQPVLEKAGLVDTSPVIEAIDAKLSPGVNPLLNPKSELPLTAEQQELAQLKKQLLTGNGEQLFDPKRLHFIQSDIGDRAYQLSRSPDPKDRFVGASLRNMNEKLIDQIDLASGGDYRPARQLFKSAKDVQAAFDSGFDTLKNREGLVGATEDSPAALQEWKKGASPQEIEARKLGTRAAIDQKINTMKNGALAGGDFSLGRFIIRKSCAFCSDRTKQTV